jgi:cytochrome c oxidase subunit 1/cytochrome c oxidase subunit I+III
LATTALDAAPDMILEMPKDSFAPVLLAAGLAIVFVGLLLKAWVGAGVGAAVVTVALVNWMWPRIDLLERKPAHG